MGKLIEQFIEAAESFALRTKRPHFDIPLWSMVATGAWRYRAISPPVKPESLSVDDQDLLGDAAARQHFTSAQVREWLEYLVSNRKMEEEFLVLGLTRFVELRLESISEDRSRGRMRIRRIIATVDELLANSDQAEEMLDDFNRRRSPGTPELTRERLPEIGEDFKSMVGDSSLESMKSDRFALDTWRELTLPLTHMLDSEEGVSL